jgi:micrococcal nuclease
VLRAWTTTSAVWALGALVACGDAGADCTHPPPPAGLQAAAVVRVLDGGSIRVRLGRRSETVRYLGVVVPRLDAQRPDAHQAQALNQQLVEGRTVRLQLDDEARFPDGALRAYVYAGDVMVNAELVCRGYAEAATGLPPHRYQDLFLGLEREAREAGRGRWPRVTVRNGSVSVSFNATPGNEALRAIARATGVSLAAPPSAARRTLTLAIAGRPLEEVLRRVLAALDLGGMALVYGPLGRVTRVIVVEAGREARSAVPRRAPAPSARPRW